MTNDRIDQLIDALDAGAETMDRLQRQLRDAEGVAMMAEALAFLGELDVPAVEQAKDDVRDLADALAAERHIAAVRRLALRVLRERADMDA